MSLGLVILTVVAGGLGAACRYSLDYAITQRVRGVMPWGTAAINVSGSLALGLLVGAALHGPVSPEAQFIISGGFLGAYTTFSTWMYESLRLIEQGAWPRAMANLAGSAIAGTGMAALGLTLATKLWG